MGVIQRKYLRADRIGHLFAGTLGTRIRRLLSVAPLYPRLAQSSVLAALPSVTVKWVGVHVSGETCAGITPVAPHPNYQLVAFYCYSESLRVER